MAQDIAVKAEKHLPKGVFLAYKKDKTPYYRSSFTYKNKHISLGSFDTAKEANLAYREALRLVKDNKYSLTSYNSKRHLSFGKWVSIINFRDNGYYFKTPIYMKQRYFIYYLDQSTELKFDVDDLFFYSTHTIMKRDGHLFVSDYGMQLNIKNRYGIKNFAVAGKDYIFVNGDDTDFRYGNIKIINRYNGVSKEEKKGRISYVCKIHINGDYIIGRYSSEIDAAIAYNKAIDILKNKGININYTINYIEDISSKEYAERYAVIKISKKLKNIKYEV
ncbi:MAG: hypothetical protein E7266_01905 [Lachnospiraceae bacterium]|nr:hypothetical protein [Lachnospiraceae bacterium]